jgi:hypothetical protein
MELIIIECIRIGRGTGVNLSKKGNDGCKTQEARTGTKEGWQEGSQRSIKRRGKGRKET